MFFRYRRTIIFTLWLLAAAFFLYEFFLRTFVGTLASQIIPALHLNMGTFSWLEASYALAYGLMQVPAGMIADRFGLVRSLLMGLLICGIATILFSQSEHLVSALFARALMGIGSAFGFVCLISVVVKYFLHRHFAFMAGISQFVGTVGPMLAGGPLVNLLHQNHNQWRSSLLYIALIAFILAVLILLLWRMVPAEPSGRHVEPSLVTEPFWMRLKTLCRNRQIWLIAVYSGAIYISLALMGAVWGTAFLQSKGFSQVQSAYTISSAWLGYALGCPILGLMSDWRQRRKGLLSLCTLLGFVATLFILFLKTQNIADYWLIFFGLGVAASGQNIAIIAMVENAGKNIRSTAIGLNNAVITIFTTAVPPLIGLMINAAAQGRVTDLKPSAFIAGLVVMPLFFLLALVLIWFFIRETHGKTVT